MTRKLLALTLVLATWVAGTVAGSLDSSSPATAAPLLVVGRAHADHYPAFDGTDPIFVLVLGSDSRPGTPVDRGLADSIHIVGINPVDRRATIFGFPRDAYVTLASGGSGKINSAMPQGGVEAQITTVENLTGIRFDYYALTGFNGLKKAVDEIGGLMIDVPYAVTAYERTIPEGEQTLDGVTALAYARTRKSLSLGDFGRSMNQGRMLIAALGQFRTSFAADQNAMFTWLGAGLRHVETSLSIEELTSFAFLATQVKPMGVSNLVAIGTIGSAGGSSIVNLTDANQALYQDLAADGYILPRAIPAQAKPGD